MVLLYDAKAVGFGQPYTNFPYRRLTDAFSTNKLSLIFER